MPRLRGLEDDEHYTEFAHAVVPFACQAWIDLQHLTDGMVRFDHDHYLKMWALARPKTTAEYLLLDEAQDTNPVVEQIFTAQHRPA